MCGHSPAPTVAAINAQLQRGVTTMLPSEDAGAVGELMADRFGLRHWQFTVSATDANRFLIRLCRQVTRPDRRSSSTTTATTAPSTRPSSRSATDGEAVPRYGSIGPPVDPVDDHPRRRDQRPRGARARAGPRGRRLHPDRAGADEHRHRPPRPRLPRGAAAAGDQARDAADHRRDPHAELRARAATRGAYGLEPDAISMGKPIAGGIPTGAYGLSDELAAPGPRRHRLGRRRRRRRRRHARRQRAPARRRPGDARRGADAPMPTSG